MVFSRYILFIVLTYFCQLLTSCVDLDRPSNLEKQAEIDEKNIEAYLAENNIEATKDPIGLYYWKIEENNSGDSIAETSILHIDYKVSDLRGDVVEAQEMKINHGSGLLEPIIFDFGLSFMREGEKYGYIIPYYILSQIFSSNQLYGGINLIYEVELLDIVSFEEQDSIDLVEIQNYVSQDSLTYDFIDSSFYHHTFTSASDTQLVAGEAITVDYIIYNFDGQVLATTVDSIAKENGIFDNGLVYNAVTYQVGDSLIFDAFANSYTFIDGWIAAINVMKKKEYARFIIPSVLAYREERFALPTVFSNYNITPEQNLILDINIQ